MSNPIDALIPPRQADFAIVPLPEDDALDEDNLVPEDYDYDTHLMIWKCKSCGCGVVDTDLHTSWHERLDMLFPPG